MVWVVTAFVAGNRGGGGVVTGTGAVRMDPQSRVQIA